METPRRIPVLDPILIALRSRRVIIAIISIVVALLVAYAPQLAAVQDALIVLVGTLALALIGGLSWEDAARLSRDRAEQPLGTPDTALRDAILAILQETGVLPIDAEAQQQE
jgi:Na+/proline symporter